MIGKTVLHYRILEKHGECEAADSLIAIARQSGRTPPFVLEYD